MYRRHPGGPVPAGSQRYAPYRGQLAGLAGVPAGSRRTLRKEFPPAARTSASKPSAEARHVVNKKIGQFPAGRKRFYNSGPLFPTRRKGAMRLAGEGDKKSCATPAAATVKPRAEVCSTDLWLRSAVRPPRPWKSSWHGHPGHDLARARYPSHLLGISALTFVSHTQPLERIPVATCAGRPLHPNGADASADVVQVYSWFFVERAVPNSDCADIMRKLCEP